MFTVAVDIIHIKNLPNLYIIYDCTTDGKLWGIEMITKTYDCITFWRVWLRNLPVFVSLSWVHRGRVRRESAINHANKGKLCPGAQEMTHLEQTDLWGCTTETCASVRVLLIRDEAHRWVYVLIGKTMYDRGLSSRWHQHTAEVGLHWAQTQHTVTHTEERSHQKIKTYVLKRISGSVFL